jgi:hypothetical protein
MLTTYLYLVEGSRIRGSLPSPVLSRIVQKRASSDLFIFAAAVLVRGFVIMWSPKGFRGRNRQVNANGSRMSVWRPEKSNENNVITPPFPVQVISPRGSVSRK